MADYTARIKDICDSLASINVIVEEDDMVQVCLGGLASKFGAFRMVVCTTGCYTRRRIGPVVMEDEDVVHRGRSTRGGSD